MVYAAFKSLENFIEKTHERCVDAFRSRMVSECAIAIIIQEARIQRANVAIGHKSRQFFM